ncbi:MAG: hypothetical protein KDA67_06145 [Rhodobacteraceae bacterium]|nr:hypothetical protein [Paracoccaceae bacterium]
MIKYLKPLVAATAMLVAGAANAAVLDFTEVAPDWQGSNTITLSNATIVTSGPDSYVFGSNNSTPPFGPTGGFCGLTSVNGYSCNTDATVTFNSAITNLMFKSAQYDPGDNVVASIFAGATLLAQININSAMLVDFTGYSGITSLFLDDGGGNGAGFAYGAFTFDTAQVPLPLGLPLLGSGLVLLGLLRRRKTS